MTDDEWQRTHDEAVRRRSEAHAAFRRARAHAGIFLGEAPMSVLRDMEDEWHRGYPSAEEFDFEEQLDREADAASRAYDLLIATARTDLLGIERTR